MIRLLVASALMGFVLCDNKKCGPCQPTPKVYEELRCVGVLDNDGCCFERLNRNKIFVRFCNAFVMNKKNQILDLNALIGML